MIYEIQLQTKKLDEMLDITAHVEKILVRENVQDGLIVVYSPHTTAGITINENADPDVQKDILRRLDEIYPREDDKDRSVEVQKIIFQGFDK
ncbi:MAG: secondary thiamine-phosphate synthase enzyme YjbQ [Desulfosporosinus sp.]|nr:secondary thiamine-phosphate synthase enzyme YjbQ [Desulfosporosinus sp.]